MIVFETSMKDRIRSGRDHDHGGDRERHCNAINYKQLNEHLAGHILKERLDPRACGYCGHVGKGCTVGLGKSGLGGASATFHCIGDCKMDPHAWKGFQLGYHEEGKDSNCSQQPLTCPLCPGEVHFWKYALH